jgi:NAD(P)H dehydrogenase (quinone)
VVEFGQDAQLHAQGGRGSFHCTRIVVAPAVDEGRGQTCETCRSTVRTPCDDAGSRASRQPTLQTPGSMPPVAPRCSTADNGVTVTLPKLAITGATGALGGRVARRLAECGVEQRLVVRDLSTAPSLTGATSVAAPSYADTRAMREALVGTRTLFLVSGREAEDRLQQHYSAIEAAAGAGVERIVYLSFVGAAPDATFTLARQHYATEERIRAAGVRYTFLRSSLYADCVPSMTGEDLVIRGPAGAGKVAWICRDDIAAVATTILLAGDEHDGQTYDDTGPESVSLAQTAEILGRVVNREVTYHAESMEEAWESRKRYGAPAWEVEGWVTSYAAVAMGEMDVVSDAVETITGTPAQDLDSFLRANPTLWKHFAG